jgi:hypothetical protein
MLEPGQPRARLVLYSGTISRLSSVKQRQPLQRIADFASSFCEVLGIGYHRPYSLKNYRGILPRGIVELPAKVFMNLPAKVFMNYWKGLRPLLLYSSVLSTNGAVISSGQDLENVNMLVNPVLAWGHF